MAYPHPFHKRLELWFGELFIRVLSLLVRRKRVMEKVDFNTARVLLLRQNQIGDTLISTPIIAALKARYPGIALDVLLDKRNRSVFDSDANIRNRLIIKLTRFDIFSALSRIRRERYDFIVDLVHTPSMTSTALCLLSKARYTVGFERENDFIYDVKVRLEPQPRMLLSLAGVLRVFGIEPDAATLRPYFNLTPSSVEFAERVTSRLRQGKKTLIGINISASKRTKFWGHDKFVRLVKLLQSLCPSAAVVILHSRDYREDAEHLASETGAVVCDETKTLSDFAAVISKVDLLITPDSAAAHFADIFRTPAVILTNNPEGVTVWYPSFTEFVSVHSVDDYVSHIGYEEVAGATESFVKKLGWDEPAPDAQPAIKTA